MSWLLVALLLPLVLALPGYALCAALFPPGSIPPAERAVYALALSASVAGLSGVVVQIAIPLSSTIWAVSLLAVTIGAFAVAARRHRRPAWGRPAKPILRLPNPADLAAMGLAVAIGVWAFSIAVGGAREDRDASRFTELWALPQPGGDGIGQDASVAIGVANHQGHPVRYRVRASRGEEKLREWDIRLLDGGRWRGSLPMPPATDDAPLRVALLRGDTAVRRVFVRSELVP